MKKYEWTEKNVLGGNLIELTVNVILGQVIKGTTGFNAFVVKNKKHCYSETFKTREMAKKYVEKFAEV